MIPQAGSAYAYSLRHARRTRGVDHRLGPDPRIRGRQRRGRDLVGRLLQLAASRASASRCRTWLTHGYRTALLSANPDVHGCSRPRRASPASRSSQPPGVRHRGGRHLAAAARREGERARQQRDGGDQAARARPLHRRRRHAHRPGELHAVRAERLHRHPSGRGDRLLRLHRLRRHLDRGRGDAAIRSATCRSAFWAASRSAR